MPTHQTTSNHLKPRLKHALSNLMLSCTIALSSFTAIANADVTRVVEKQFAFDLDGKISLSNINGNVTITGCNCNQVSLTALIEASDSALLDRIEVRIKQSKAQLSVATHYKENYENDYKKHQRSSVTYTLSVPNDVNLNGISLVNGDLNLSRVTGKLKSELVNGNLNSDSTASSTQVDMVNGNAEVVFSDLSQVEFINFESVNGNIQLSLPSDLSATFDIETVSGRITNQFGLAVNRGKYVGSSMRGQLGKGTTQVKIDNVNGKININQL
ncbi:DUF4097 family beta strand repeat-containing protein [Aliikangiella sp. IMCC44632]